MLDFLLKKPSFFFIIIITKKKLEHEWGFYYKLSYMLIGTEEAKLIIINEKINL